MEMATEMAKLEMAKTRKKMARKTRKRQQPQTKQTTKTMVPARRRPSCFAGA